MEKTSSCTTPRNKTVLVGRHLPLTAFGGVSRHVCASGLSFFDCIPALTAADEKESLSFKMFTLTSNVCMLCSCQIQNARVSELQNIVFLDLRCKFHAFRAISAVCVPEQAATLDSPRSTHSRGKVVYTASIQRDHTCRSHSARTRPRPDPKAP